MTEKALECKNITKKYGNVEALKGVSFYLENNGILGLSGDNGAGKSTLIKILRGVIKPTSGEIFLHGEKVNFPNPEDANKAGLYSVYQESALVDNLSVAENFFLGNEVVNKFAKMVDMVDMDKQEKEAKSYLKDRGFDLDVTKNVGSFSGGQRRAIAILRALYAKPEILLLDEPTTGLSVKAKEMMLGLFQEIRDEVSMIFVSHSPEDVINMCDRLLVLRLGQQSFFGSIAEIERDEIVSYY